jgi:nucleotide-binding universal stress UspA family protein
MVDPGNHLELEVMVVTFSIGAKHVPDAPSGSAGWPRHPAGEFAVTELVELTAIRPGSPCLVVGVECSDASLRAVCYAAGLARRQGAALLCVHVQPLPPYEYAIAWCPELALLSSGSSPVPDALREELDTQLRLWAVPYQLVGRVGDIAREIGVVADQVRAQAVVVGVSRTHTRRLGRSCSAKLARTGRWPLVVVP